MAYKPAMRALATATAALTLVFLAAAQPAADEPKISLAPPEGEVLLTITGAVDRANAPEGARLDLAALESLGLETLRTSTPWTEGTPVFKGVPVRAVLELVRARGDRVRAIAANDYSYEMPISDFRDYPVLLAVEMNGERLQMRDKGPIWMVYPIDQFDALQNRTTERKMVWQLKELRVE
jgi:hypothetical protein